MESSSWDFQFRAGGAMDTLVKFKASVSSAFDGFNAKENSFNAKLKETGNIIKSNTTSTDGFAGSVKRLIATVGVLAIGKEILATGAAMEQTNVAFQVLMGGVDVAKSKVSELQKFADISPFNTTEVMGAGQSLLGFGVQAKELLPIMNMLGDVSMGNSAKFSSAIDNYGKLVSSQRANTMDLNQFAIAGIPIWNELGKQIGLQGKPLRDYVEQNGASVAQVNQALSSMTGKGGAFYDMMKKQSESTAGKWSTFVSQLQTAGVRIFNALQPVLNQLMELGANIMPYVESAILFVVDAFKWLWDFATEHKTLLKTLGFIVLSLGTAFYVLQAYMWLSQIALKAQILWMGITEIATGGLTVALELLNLAMLANPAFLIVAGLVAVIGVVVWLWNSFEGFRKFLYSLWGSIKEVFSGIVDYIWDRITALWDFLKGFGKILMGVFTLDWKTFKEGLNDIGTGLKKTFSVEKIIDIGYKASYGWQEGNSKFYIDKDKKKEEEAAKDNQTSIPKGYDNKLVGGGTVAPGTSTGSSGGSSTKEAKNIYITIQNLVGKFEVHTSQLSESASQVKDSIQQALIAAINDSELAIS